MNKNALKNIALILLLSITAFSMVRYVSELKARYRLQDSLSVAEEELAILAQERQKLLQELEKEKALQEQILQKNANLKLYIKASTNKIMNLFQSNSRTKSNLEDINTKFSILKAENKALIDSRKRIYLQNEEFKAKLSSVAELKKAIRALRGKKQKPSVFSVEEGNEGYLIKDGQSTTIAKVKIEVVPAQTKE
ncbi:MAG: hypothetical protein PHS66_07625 [Candidatus Omnitrophica bacterium]|nr:hypothetical protein [Candidatus Omnitrophota bacterium]